MAALSIRKSAIQATKMRVQLADHCTYPDARSAPRRRLQESGTAAVHAVGRTVNLGPSVNSPQTSVSSPTHGAWY